MQAQVIALPNEPDGEIAPAFSDDDIALTFAQAAENELRFVAAWNKWMRFDGTKWASDDTLSAYDSVRVIVRDYANTAEGRAVAIASAKTVAAVERLARSDRRLCATVDQWDSDPWLLNTPAGPIHLRTGAKYNRLPGYYLTKVTAVAPGGECPIWRKVLDRLTGGDADLQAFISRLFGYALTGSTKEHALFFVYGTGGNGKSLLLNTVANVMGDYATSASVDTFTASAFERHPTDLADLRGSRLVTAIETEEGRQWAEARIKSLTGGDRVKARFMRQDFFEYVPQFKLVIAGNHKPSLRNVDEAMRRRLNLVPFDVTIPPGERDPDLAEKLKAEWPGILQWMIDGCTEWQRIGLAPPAAVTAATNAYMVAEDAMANWIAERCMLDPQHTGKASELFKDWKRWAENAGEHAGTQKKFSQNLEVRGYRSKHTMTGNRFLGITLAPQMTGD